MRQENDHTHHARLVTPAAVLRFRDAHGGVSEKGAKLQQRVYPRRVGQTNWERRGENGNSAWEQQEGGVSVQVQRCMTQLLEKYAEGVKSPHVTLPDSRVG